MLIRHKGIYKDRFEDAPWVGTLVSSISCPYKCKGCINDPMKPIAYHTIDSEELIRSIKSNPFNEGIILGGLEWTEQPDELLELIDKALEYELNIILYTYLPHQDALLKKVPDLDDYKGVGILVKYGKYDETKRIYDYRSHGVLLATSNQYVEEL